MNSELLNLWAVLVEAFGIELHQVRNRELLKRMIREYYSTKPAQMRLDALSIAVHWSATNSLAFYAPYICPTSENAPAVRREAVANFSENKLVGYIIAFVRCGFQNEQKQYSADDIRAMGLSVVRSKKHAGYSHTQDIEYFLQMVAKTKGVRMIDILSENDPQVVTNASVGFRHNGTNKERLIAAMSLSEWQKHKKAIGDWLTEKADELFVEIYRDSILDAVRHLRSKYAA